MLDEVLFIDVFVFEKLSVLIKNYVKNNLNIDMIVIIDGEGVFGIGDWGVNGVKIVVGKLVVYMVVVGFVLDCVFLVVIDVGMNNEIFFNDLLYLGNKCFCFLESEYDVFIVFFVNVMKEVFLKVIFYWEDFGCVNVSCILYNYCDKICIFNDDI